MKALTGFAPTVAFEPILQNLNQKALRVSLHKKSEGCETQLNLGGRGSVPRTLAK